MPLLDTHQKRRRVVLDAGRPTFSSLAELEAAEAAGLATRPTFDRDPLDPSTLTVETEEPQGENRALMVWLPPAPGRYRAEENERGFFVFRDNEEGGTGRTFGPEGREPDDLVLGGGDRARGVDRRRLVAADKGRRQQDQARMRSWNDTNRRAFRLPPISGEAA